MELCLNDGLLACIVHVLEMELDGKHPVWAVSCLCYVLSFDKRACGTLVNRLSGIELLLGLDLPRAKPRRVKFNQCAHMNMLSMVARAFTILAESGVVDRELMHFSRVIRLRFDPMSISAMKLHHHCCFVTQSLNNIRQKEAAAKLHAIREAEELESFCDMEENIIHDAHCDDAIYEQLLSHRLEEQERQDMQVEIEAMLLGKQMDHELLRKLFLSELDSLETEEDCTVVLLN